MNNNDVQLLKYPIGKFQTPAFVSTEKLRGWIQVIAAFPLMVEREVRGLDEEGLNSQYRPGGWNIRQLVHHCADSHMNSFIRFKLALTEDTPVIRPYFEDRWAALTDSTQCSIESSLLVLKGLHERWSFLLQNLTENELDKQFEHPETNDKITLNNIGVYAWHCEHHLAHIRLAKQLVL